jgi:septum formation protein
MQVSAVDEAAELAARGVQDPLEVPLLLARLKAEDIAGRKAAVAGRKAAVASRKAAVAGRNGAAGVVVVGCDSVLDLDGVAVGKPADADDAVRIWRQMRGRSAVLRTGHWLIDTRTRPHRAVGARSDTVVHFAELADAEIEAYVASGEPLAVAGGFTVDGRGGPFVRAIEGDYHGVVGISLPLLRELLLDLDIRWPDLWG